MGFLVELVLLEPSGSSPEYHQANNTHEMITP
jgi:hypothetical protein